MKSMRLAASVVAMLMAGSLAAQAEIQLANSGELRVLTNPIYPPMEYVNPEDGTLTGFDIDLATAIAGKLKLEPFFVTSAFQELASGLQTGRGDLIISGMSDNPKRQETMDFVDYFVSGPILFTTKANTETYKDTVDLCGKKIAGSRSTSFGDNVKAWSEANCVAADKPAMEFEGTADSNAARLGLKQGRYDAVVQGVETIAYQMRLEPDTFVLVGKPILSNDTFGIGVKKENTELRDAVAKAVDELIADGSYGELLKKWDLTLNGVEKAVVNGAK